MGSATSSRSRASWLALLSAFTAGVGLGFLAHEYREVIVANPGIIGLTLLVVFAAGYLIRLAVRALRRAGSRVDTILAEELEKKPSPRPR
ncbi:hypothetical protein [Amycolatopsis rifamycinica]|uniref:Uncharacterized protein n=1 Tax=Amycolatopsis rifamycinica TaxID=287986 RepID=A0A066UHM1_9PSEU|nr:hypothetical protein [Amycolatopsis rifamycinica]KDN23688.1 hypothetical protein DV20_02915 [Amycolatopsis rifamycinica]